MKMLNRNNSIDVNSVRGQRQGERGDGVDLTADELKLASESVQKTSQAEREEKEKKDKIDKLLKMSFLGKYLAQDTVTDISFNGTDLYIQDNIQGRYKVPKSEGVREHDIFELAYKVAGVVGKNFTVTDPILDTELDYLRLNFIHKDVSPFGTTMAIRVSKPRLAVKSIADLADKDVEILLQLLMASDTNLIISGRTGSGKPLCNSELIPTPEGYLLNGDLKVGDYVYNRYGKPTKVVGVFPKGKLDVYEVRLKDDRVLRCGLEHRFSVFTSKGNLKTFTVEELLERGLTMKRKNENCYQMYIPTNGAVEKSEKEFKVHPYVMGAFLGDGCLTQKVLTLSSEDDWIPTKVASLIGAKGVKKDKNSYSWYFRLCDDFNHEENDVHRSCVNYQTSQFFSEDMRKTCGFRYIPKEYFEGSIEQRYQLLQGLMDTDGCISNDKAKRHNVTFTTTSEQLKKDIIELARSLGYEVTCREQERRGVMNYTVNFLVPNYEKQKLFSLPRKKELAESIADLPKRALYDRIAIKSITKLPYQEEMTCIEVEDEEHLFLAGQYFVNHNTEVVRHVSN